MKKAKVCALLCVMAMGVNPVLPAMAAESTVESAETVEETGQEEENQAEEETQEPGSNANESGNGAVGQSVGQQTGDAQTPIAETPAAEAEPSTQIDDAIPENGWYTDGYGNTYYYVDGEMACDQVIEEEDNGRVYGYYLLEDGTLLKDDGRYATIEGNWGWISADAEGHLRTGWVNEGGKRHCYGEDYIRYANKLLDARETLYYFDGAGDLVINDNVIVDGIPYHADANGVLTQVGVNPGQWLPSGGQWYYCEGGKIVTNAYRIIKGIEYHFGADGVMSTGAFEDGEKVLLAETDGSVVRHGKGWYYSQQSKTWYYFKIKDQVARSERMMIKGKEYCFDENGAMRTGSFLDNGEYVFADASGAIVTKDGWQKMNNKWYYIKGGKLVHDTLLVVKGATYYFGSDGEMRTGCFMNNGEYVFADASGAIVTKDGWQKMNNKWYYIKGGKVVHDTLLDVKGATYYFGSDGEMQTGKLSLPSDAAHYYITDASGAIMKQKWVRQGTTWVYAGADGRLVTSEWVGKRYLKEDGTMAVGAVDIDDKIYVFDADGYLIDQVTDKDGWKKEDGQWHYYTEDGMITVGLQGIGDKIYVFDDNGCVEGIIGSKAGWQKLYGQWYYYIAPGKPYNGWLNGKWYIQDGRMLTNERVSSYYVGADGTIQNGWIYDGYDWLYSVNGKLVEDGWRKIGRYWYYFDYYRMVTNCVYDVDWWPNRFDASGHWLGKVTKPGWVKQGNSWYYVNEYCELNKEPAILVNGRVYYFGYDGAMLTNTKFDVDEYGNSVWVDANGTYDMTDGWKKDKFGTWYYVKDGEFLCGHQLIEDRKYYFDDSGALRTGIYFENGQYKYADENGEIIVLTSGWYDLKTDGSVHRHYFVDGEPARGWVDGYYFDYDGMMVTGIINLRGNGWAVECYAFDNDGHLRKNQWFVEDGSWYYAGSTGHLYRGERKIGNKTYWFTNDGRWVK